MVAIIQREFWELFKGVKSLIILALFLGATYLTGHFVNNNPILMSSDSGLLGSSGQHNVVYLAGLRILVALFGSLFIVMLSHDVVNREVESQTIRLLVTKTSRASIIIGKYVGIFAFWFVVLFLSFVMVTVMSKQFFGFEFFQLLSFLSLLISVSLLLSLLIKKPSLSIAVGLLVSLSFPIVGLWSNFSDLFIMKYVLRFVFPYYYLFRHDFLMVVPFLFSLLILGIATVIFERRDL